MKKLSILVALILCVTIGGVYATWSYSGGTANESQRTFEIGLTAYTNTGAKGTIYSIDNSLVVKLDDSNADFIAEVLVDGFSEFVFTPNVGATPDVVANGIPLKATLGQVGVSPATTVQYKGADLFTIDTSAVELTITKITDANKATLGSKDLSAYVGSFYAKVSASDIEGKITLAQTVSLPTLVDYNAFLGNVTGKLSITVSEKLS
ncbi:MAG: hypothetical protein IKL40_02325 [Clostridia bacterium]|nr:hypothetical protein [Clostridia bacterium]